MSDGKRTVLSRGVGKVRNADQSQGNVISDVLPHIETSVVFRAVLFLTMILTLHVGIPNFVNAQDSDPPAAAAIDSASKDDTTASKVTADQIDQLLKTVQSAGSLEDDVKQAITSSLNSARESLARAEGLVKQTTVDQQAVKEASATADALRTKLAKRPKELEELNDPSATLPDLLSKLASIQPELQSVRDDIKKWETEASRRSSRRTEITTELAKAPSAVASLKQKAAKLGDAQLSAIELRAQNLLCDSQLQELAVRVPALQAEQSRYDSEKAVDLLNLRLQLAQRTEAELQQQVGRLKSVIAEKRRNDARYVSTQLQEFAEGKQVASPYRAGADLREVGPLKSASHLKLARQTAEFAQSNVTVTSEVEFTSASLLQVTDRLNGIQDLVAGMNKKIERVGLTGAIGLELRQHLQNLPDTRELRAKGRNRQQQMQDLEFKRLDLSDQLAITAKELAKVRGTTDQETSDVDLRLLVDRHESLKLLSNSYSDYFDRLSDLDIQQKELIHAVDDYQSFIREQVLWIRSQRMPSLDDVKDMKKSLAEILRTDNWMKVFQQLWKDLASSLWVYVIFVVLQIILFGIQGRFRANLEFIAEAARRPGCRAFRITLRAFVLTLVLAAAWPGLPAFIGWRLLQQDVSDVFVRAVGHGFVVFAIGFFSLSLLRQLCRTGGLGNAHFGWSKEGTQYVRQVTRKAMWFLLPLLFLRAILHYLDLSSSRILERFVFVAASLVLAWYEARIFHPNHGIFSRWARQKGGWLYQLRWVAFTLVVGLPLLLAAMAIGGYYYTAYELNWRLNLTLSLIAGLLVFRAFFLRLLLIRHRQLRLEQARIRRQAVTENIGNQSEQPVPLVIEDVVDLKTVSSQSRRLADSAFVLIGIILTAIVWADVHPALGVLDKWTVWYTTVEETVGYVNETDGANRVRIDQKRVPVTFADCLVSLGVIAITITATRNLPGFLEITFLQKLPIEPSVRYAIRMVSQYIMVFIGMTLALANIGIGWEKIQWLAAGLTVGLGFGLQEIFANFISGIIILFERPIRISDVVTIGDVTGTVSQIRMRATTITDWDLKEYIVPNKEFITGRLLNWTLSDKINRVVVEVGVAYGTDTQEARILLVEAARSVKDVMEEPHPLATFEQFGDSTLNLTLRCYLPNLENRLQAITDLHEQIAARFHKAGVEISFPQLDLHVVDHPAFRDS